LNTFGKDITKAVSIQQIEYQIWILIKLEINDYNYFEVRYCPNCEKDTKDTLMENCSECWCKKPPKSKRVPLENNNRMLNLRFQRSFLQEIYDELDKEIRKGLRNNTLFILHRIIDEHLNLVPQQKGREDNRTNQDNADDKGQHDQEGQAENKYCKTTEKIVVD